MYRKCTVTRLRKVFNCYHDRKLYHWNMGTFALVQLNFEDHCKMETANKTPEQHRRDGITDREWLFFTKDLKDINRCRIYLRVFYISDISTLDGQGITAWSQKGRQDGGRKSSWARPVQQRPTSCKAWKLALKYLASDGCVVPQ
jgi:hypothetical protein